MWAIRRQLDKMDAAFWPCEKSPDIWPFVIGGVVPDNVDHSLVGIARLNLGEKLRCADTIDGSWLDKGRIEGFKIEHTMDIHAALVGTPGFEPVLTQPKAGFV